MFWRGGYSIARNGSQSTLSQLIKLWGFCVSIVVKYFEGYFKFISCLCLTFHSWLESCYNQFIDQGSESVFVSTGFRILLPFEVVFQHECHLCHLLNLIVSPWSGHVLEPSLIRVPSSEFLFWFKVESREFSCHAFIGFLMGFFIPLWLSTGNLFKSLGKAFVTLMVSKPKRTYVLLI